MSFIELHNVTKNYAIDHRETCAVDNLSFDIEEGEFITVRGKSGSGKSTLLKLMAGILSADEGQILVRGRDINRLKEKERSRYRRESVGIVFQSFELLPYHNVLENIMIPLYLNHMQYNPVEIDVLLQELGILHLKKAFPDELSGGEQQRVAIARALIHEPDVLLLDEPTGNLDSENSNQFMDVLQHVYEKKKTTILLVTHDDFIAQYAKRTIFIRNGKIANHI